MGRKRKHFDYRQFYREYYGIDFGPEMAVHHIDFDRDNNAIENLLLLPVELHQRYHECIRQLLGAKSGFVDLRLDGLCKSSEFPEPLESMAQIFREVQIWQDIKYSFSKMPKEEYFKHYPKQVTPHDGGLRNE